MHVPPNAGGRSIVAAVVLLGLTGPLLAWAGQDAPRPGSKESREAAASPSRVAHQSPSTTASGPTDAVRGTKSPDGDLRKLSPEQVKLLLAMTLLRSPYVRKTTNPPANPPVDDPPPIVVPPPKDKKTPEPPDDGDPKTNHAPEPASVVTALVGATLGAFACWRHRGRKRGKKVVDESPSPE